MHLTGFEARSTERCCGRVGPLIARAVHSQGGGDSGRGAKWLLSNEHLGRLLPERREQPLHDRMLSRPELLGMFFTQSPHDGERSQLRLCSKSAFDRGDVRRAWMACEPSFYNAAWVAGASHADRRR